MLDGDRLRRLAPHKTNDDVDRAVRALIRHAVSVVPYYRRLFAVAGLSAEDIRGTSDLFRIPTSRRDDMAARSTSERMDPSIDPRRCFRHQTSGSSGTPLTLTMSRTEWRFRRAMLGLVLYRASHVLPPVRIVEIGRVLKPGRSPITGVPGLFTVVKPPGQASSAEQHAWITRYRPQIVEGFPTALDVLVEECRKNGWRLPKPRLVVCRGEVLFPDVRRSLEEGFGAPVVDHYNCEEIGNVAWQCPADPDVMHINTAACVVEVVDAQGVPLEPNETGFIALTNLYNHTMPFIRYLVGDRGRLLEPDGSPCRCGFRGLSMALVDGRSDDIVRLPTGQRLSPRVVATVMFRRPDGSRIAGIRKYQLIQSALDRAKLRVVLEEKRDADWHEVLLANGRTLLAGIDLEIEEVPEIPFEHSGKYRRIVRRLS